ncbi:MAG: (Fe-S)-binding protein [Rhodobacterales bacterium]|nr:(Fe-S)-binding protein [Rhodobacterales bacterium]
MTVHTRPEKPSAEAAVQAFLGQIDASIASYLETCVHCGECAEACHFYEVTKDPRYTPTWKLQPMVRAYKRHLAPFSGLKRALGLAPSEVTLDELEEWSELVYDACTMCARCTVVCPMGIDIATAIRRMREGMVAAGVAPEGLHEASDRALNTGSPLGLTLRVLQKQIADQEKETGIPVPVDVKGADYLVILSAMELIGFPEVIGALSRIFKQANVSWTFSSAAFEATNVGVQIGSKEIATSLLGRVVDAAEALEVKYLISPECGHAYGALKWEGPNMMGRNYEFEVIHILELLEELRLEGRLRIGGKDSRRLAFHDPCQIVRRGGVVAEPRNLMAAVAANQVVTAHAGINNYCCGGGGGVSSNHRAEELRFKAFAVKKRQLEEAGGVDALVTACANCRNVLEEAIDEYEMDLPVLSLTELLAEYLEPEGGAG